MVHFFLFRIICKYVAKAHDTHTILSMCNKYSSVSICMKIVFIVLIDIRGLANCGSHHSGAGDPRLYKKTS